MKFNIAIDGPSAAGKSTIAQLLADKYKLIKLDTGAMYRCVGYLVKKMDLDVNDEDSVLKVFNNFDLEIKADGSIYLNSFKINEEIRNDEISMLASMASKHLKVRNKLVALQREIASEKGYVLEGRDIGTVVLPDALIKIFLEADLLVRVQRRFDEYKSKGMQVDFQQIKSDMNKRDFQDRNRKHSPLLKADDAIVIDVSYLSLDEIIEQLSKIIDKKLGVLHD